MTTSTQIPLPLKGFKILHRIPGRTRFRIPLLAQHPNCAATIRGILERTAGLTHIRINQAARSLIVCYDPEQSIEMAISQRLSDGLQQLSQGDFSTPGRCPEVTESRKIACQEAASSAESRSSLYLPVLAASLALLSRIPQLAKLRPLAAIAFLAAAFPIARRAFHSAIAQQRLNIDCLDFLALSLSAWQGRLVTPAMVIVLHELGDAIREQTARATEVQTANLMDAIGRFAWVKSEDGPPQQIPSDRVQVGDTVIVYPGEQIPVDGTVLQGEAIVDRQSLTGESMPVVHRVGASALASTLVRSGQLYIRADRVGQQTRAAASIELLQKAPVHDTRMANYAEKVADRLILPSLLLAAIVLAATRNPARAAAILTLDFVTGIRVSIPTAFLGALNHTTRHGILVRSGRTLEQLAEVDTVVFDKTGTLTQGTIAIAGVTTADGGMSEEDLLRLAAAAEQRLNHPVAEAIVRHACDRGLTIPSRGEWLYEVGLGVRAEIEGRKVWVGSKRFVQQAGVDWDNRNPHPDKVLAIEGLERNSRSLIYVACDRQFQGTIQYTDPLRPHSDLLIQTLQHNYGIEVHLLTGDNPQHAAQVAQKLGIPTSRVYANAFPDEKARIVRDLHRGGRTVAFVGDGLNDSVALAYADVSVSFERGSEIARETADVVLMNNNLLDLVEAIAIARQTRNLIEQNIALVVVPNLVALGLASTVGLNPLIATAVHNGSAIAAGINSLRPLVKHQMDLGNV